MESYRALGATEEPPQAAMVSMCYRCRPRPTSCVPAMCLCDHRHGRTEGGVVGKIMCSTRSYVAIKSKLADEALARAAQAGSRVAVPVRRM